MKFHITLFYALLYYILLELIGLWILLIPDEIYFNSIEIFNFTNSLVTLGFLLLMFKWSGKTDSLKFEKTDVKYYLIAIILGIGYIVFQPVLKIIYFHDGLNSPFNNNLDFNQLNSLIVWVPIIIAPITEELLFRNFLLRNFLEVKSNNFFKSLILSSVLFALVHLSIYQLVYDITSFSFYQAYITLFIGLLSGFLFYKSKSIIPPIIFHVLWNFMNSIF